MAIFKPNTPIETTEPVIEVTMNSQDTLPPGVYRFQLVVVDSGGNASKPDIVEVIIADTKKPTAVLDAPKKVEIGDSFKLSGERSTDVPPGKIAKYIWSMVTNSSRPNQE